jgi:hypothetical protein
MRDVSHKSMDVLQAYVRDADLSRDDAGAGEGPNPGEVGGGGPAPGSACRKRIDMAHDSKQNVCQVCPQLCAMDGVVAGVEGMFTGDHGER